MSKKMVHMTFTVTVVAEITNDAETIEEIRPESDLAFLAIRKAFRQVEGLQISPGFKVDTIGFTDKRIKPRTVTPKQLTYEKDKTLKREKIKEG